MVRELGAPLLLTFLLVKPLSAQDATSQPMKSETAALAWSLAGTAVPIGLGVLLAASRQAESAGYVLIGAGALIGPSMGHFYAGNAGHGLGTIALRAAIGAAGLAGFACANGSGYCNESSNNAILAAGAILWVASVAYDVITAPASARRHNEQRLSLSIGSAQAFGQRRLLANVSVRF